MKKNGLAVRFFCMPKIRLFVAERIRYVFTVYDLTFETVSERTFMLLVW